MNIKFDKDKLNKEGITVLYRNGEKPRIVEVFDENIISICNNSINNKYGATCMHKLDGIISSENYHHPYDLIMSQESRSDEELAKEVYNKHGLDFTMQESHIKKLMLDLMTEAREDERQNHVHPNELPVNSGKLPEDIAKEVVNIFAAMNDGYGKWETHDRTCRFRFIKLVQAGIDAKSDYLTPKKD